MYTDSSSRVWTSLYSVVEANHFLESTLHFNKRSTFEEGRLLPWDNHWLYEFELTWMTLTNGIVKEVFFVARILNRISTTKPPKTSISYMKEKFNQSKSYHIINAAVCKAIGTAWQTKHGIHQREASNKSYLDMNQQEAAARRITSNED